MIIKICKTRKHDQSSQNKQKSKQSKQLPSAHYLKWSLFQKNEQVYNMSKQMSHNQKTIQNITQNLFAQNSAGSYNQFVRKHAQKMEMIS